MDKGCIVSYQHGSPKKRRCAPRNKESSCPLREDSIPRICFPESLSEIIGQRRTVKQLKMLCSATVCEKTTLPHMLFFGPPGLGKTTIAKLLAKEIHVNIEIVSCPFVHTPGQLVSILSSLKTGDILFLDELHSMSKACCESLYQAMDQFSLELLVEKKNMTKTLSLPLKKFSLIGATTHQGRLTKPFLSRFEVHILFEEYSTDDLMEIILQYAKKWEMIIAKKVAKMLASRARGVPRLALHFLKWSRRYMVASGQVELSSSVALAAIELLGIDQWGLTVLDRKILTTVVNHFGGGPIGLQALASCIGESPETIVELYEPYLLRQGFLERSPRGRIVTQKGNECVRSFENKSVN